MKEMGWVSGSGCILKDHLVVYQNALHKSCKNIYFEQQDVRLFSEEWKRDWERERCVRGRERDRDRNREDERERERGERNCLNLSSFILTPPPPPTHPWMWDRITLHVFAWPTVEPPGTWLPPEVTTVRVGRPTWITPSSFQSTFIAMNVSICTQYPCLQADSSLVESLQGWNWHWTPRQGCGKWRGTTVEHNSGTRKKVRSGRSLKREPVRQRQEAIGLGTFHLWLSGLGSQDLRNPVQPALRKCSTLK